jgi:hypothetical protein
MYITNTIGVDIMTNLGTINEAQARDFIKHRPETFQVEGGIPLEIDLLKICKHLHIPYGRAYRPQPVQMIRRDFFEYYTILRDIQKTPWEIFELDGGWTGVSPAGDVIVREALDQGIWSDLWKRWPVKEFYKPSSKIVPLYRWPAFCTKDQIEEFYPDVDFKDVQKAHRKIGTFKAAWTGTSTSHARPSVYQKVIVHLLHLGVHMERPTVMDVHNLALKHGVYKVYPYAVGPKFR